MPLKSIINKKVSEYLKYLTWTKSCVLLTDKIAVWLVDLTPELSQAILLNKNWIVCHVSH